jgi:predicted GIY-YIG superfamily endonuclease
MPRIATDWTIKPVSFYRFVCEDINIESCYVGYTTNFTNRKNAHKTGCNSGNHLKIYETMRENGGWNNWRMIEIENRICSSRQDAERIESEFINQFKTNMNTNKTGNLTAEQQLKKYQEQSKVRQTKYYLANKEILLEKKRAKYQFNKEQKQA